ncbi:semaphorin-1A-like [Anneissia japonica]|uniref:semaphorin-1A-like n=1 Tax=Anneissia japonica TaxID=1529436 RepID=UPI0014255F7A|nr:semaphorin-1A-like [Anneissia japonica]
MRVVNEWRTLFVGANNSAFVFDLDRTLESSTATKLDWMPDSVAKKKCRLKGKAEHDCQNYVKFVTPDLTNGRVLICGTNAQKPKCIYAEMSNLESGWRRMNATDGLYNCPFAVDQKVTSVFAEGSLGKRSVFLLPRSFRIKLREDLPFANRPRLHRRQGRQNDTGLQLDDFSEGATRLFVQRGIPFRFNYLLDVVRTVRGGKVFYYAVFTTGEHEIPASAICRFGLDDIRDNFERGPFFRLTAPWGRIPDEDVPDNRRRSYEDLNFVKSHPSLYEPVGSGDTLFTLVRQNYRLKTLTVTETGNRTVVFVGTDDGRVLKLVMSENRAVLLYVMRATEQPITNAGLHGKFLYVTSTDRLYEIPLQRHCRLLNDRTHKQDPHCSLMSTNAGVELEPRPSEHVQTVEKTKEDVEFEPRPLEHVPNAEFEFDRRRSEHLPIVQAKNAYLDSPSTDHISLVALAAIGWTF